MPDNFNNYSWFTQTNLRVVVQQDIGPEDTTAQVKFYNAITGAEVDPSEYLEIITLNKDKSRYEIIRFSGSSEDADGVYTLTGLTRNIIWDGYEFTEGDTPTWIHSVNDEGGAVELHLNTNIMWAIAMGRRPSGAANWYFGDGEETHQYFGFWIYNGAEKQLRKTDRINVSTLEREWSDDNGATWNRFGDAANHGTGANISAHVQMDASVDTPSQYDLMVCNTPNTWEAINYLTALPTIKTPAVYTPAFLTGGTSAESTALTWASVGDGSFRITINGVAYNVDGIDLSSISGASDMDDVAALIQAALRAVTGGLETVDWSTNKFIITSANATSSSAITVLETSTGTVGTDISGVGTAWMDAETGRGAVTDAVIDTTVYENYIPVLPASGLLSPMLGGMPTGAWTGWLTDTPPEGWLLMYGQAVSRTQYAALFAVIGTTYGSGDGATTFNIPDWRGRVALGKDNMGGTSANRVTDAAADTLGGTGGSETKNLAHTHTIAANGSLHFSNTSSSDVPASTTDSAGSATQDVMNPYITSNFIIKY